MVINITDTGITGKKKGKDIITTFQLPRFI